MTSAEVLLLYTGGLGPKAPEAVDGLELPGRVALPAARPIERQSPLQAWPQVSILMPSMS